MDDEYFKSKEFRELVSKYEKAKAANESIYLDVDEFADLSDFYLTTDAPDKAMECVEMGLNFHPDDSVLLSVKSAIYIYKHEFAEAASIIYAFDEDENQDALYQRAQLAYAFEEDVEASVKYFRKWLETNNDRDAYVHIISSYIEFGNPKICNDDFIRRWILEYIDRFSPMTDINSDIHIADVCRERNYADLCVRILSEFLEVHPYHPHGFKVLGLSQYNIGDLDGALESFDFALAISPDDNELYLGKAHTCMSKGYTEQSIECFRKYLDGGGDIVQNIPYGQCLFEIGRKDDALNCLAKVDAVVTADMAAYEAYLDNEKNGGEIDKEKRVMFDFDTYQQVYLDMADTYYVNGYAEKSKSCAKKVLEVNEHNAEAYFITGSNCLMTEDFDEAIKNFGKALSNAEDDMLMCVDIVMTLIMFNYSIDLSQLFAMLDQQAAKSKSPSTKYINAVKALASLKAEQTEEFLIYLDISASESPEFTKRVFKSKFPEDMEVEDYVEYAKNNLDTFFPKMEK